MDEPIRVLHIVGAMYPGGFENFIMNLYENLDKDKIQFDIVIHARKENDYVEKIKQMGGMVYELPRLTKNPVANLSQIYHLVKENRYRIVIRHTANALVVPQMIAAKIGGAKVICHSHTETDPQIVLHKIGRMFMNLAVTERFACSKKAGEWMFGRQKFRIIQNAIDIKRFAYKDSSVKKIQQEFKIDQKKVYGHVGNFSQTKNHKFLLSIYKEIAELEPNAVFFCLGDGELRAEIEAEILRLQLQGKVFLTGVRKDVEDFMSCFDVLIFPSKFEGLPLTVIEAQAAGLPCLLSDAISKDVVVTSGLVEWKSIDEEPLEWAKKAIEMSDVKDRKCQFEAIKNAGYDIETLAKWYETFLKDFAKCVGKEEK